MNSRKYIGMDVHKESISIAVRNDAGKIVMECVIETKASMILDFINGLSPAMRRHRKPFVVRYLKSGTVSRPVDKEQLTQLPRKSLFDSEFANTV
jgi:hypothetical protein